MELPAFGRLLAACIVVGVVLYVLKSFKRTALDAAAAPRPGGRLVRILETTALPNAASLHVVRVAGRYYVLGRSTAQITLLCELPADAVTAAIPPSPSAAALVDGVGMLRRCLARVGIMRA